MFLEKIIQFRGAFFLCFSQKLILPIITAIISQSNHQPSGPIGLKPGFYQYSLTWQTPVRPQLTPNDL